MPFDDNLQASLSRCLLSGRHRGAGAWPCHTPAGDCRPSSPEPRQGGMRSLNKEKGYETPLCSLPLPPSTEYYVKGVTRGVRSKRRLGLGEARLARSRQVPTDVEGDGGVWIKRACTCEPSGLQDTSLGALGGPCPFPQTHPAHHQLRQGGRYPLKVSVAAAAA